MRIYIQAHFSHPSPSRPECRQMLQKCSGREDAAAREIATPAALPQDGKKAAKAEEK